MRRRDINDWQWSIERRSQLGLSERLHSQSGRQWNMSADQDTSIWDIYDFLLRPLRTPVHVLRIIKIWQKLSGVVCGPIILLFSNGSGWARSINGGFRWPLKFEISLEGEEDFCKNLGNLNFPKFLALSKLESCLPFLVIQIGFYHDSHYHRRTDPWTCFERIPIRIIPAHSFLVRRWVVSVAEWLPIKIGRQGAWPFVHRNAVAFVPARAHQSSKFLHYSGRRCHRSSHRRWLSRVYRVHSAVLRVAGHRCMKTAARTGSLLIINGEWRVDIATKASLVSIEGFDRRFVYSGNRNSFFFTLILFLIFRNGVRLGGQEAMLVKLNEQLPILAFLLGDKMALLGLLAHAESIEIAQLLRVRADGPACS